MLSVASPELAIVVGPDAAGEVAAYGLACGAGLNAIPFDYRGVSCQLAWMSYNG